MGKGQLFSLDIIISFLILIAIFFMLVNYVEVLNSNFRESFKLMEINELFYRTQMLFFPKYEWRQVNLSYDELMKKLGANKEGRAYYLSISSEECGIDLKGPYYELNPAIQREYIVLVENKLCKLNVKIGLIT